MQSHEHTHGAKPRKGEKNPRLSSLMWNGFRRRVSYTTNKICIYIYICMCVYLCTVTDAWNIASPFSNRAFALRSLIYLLLMVYTLIRRLLCRRNRALLRRINWYNILAKSSEKKESQCSLRSGWNPRVYLTFNRHKRSMKVQIINGTDKKKCTLHTPRALQRRIIVVSQYDNLYLFRGDESKAD